MFTGLVEEAGVVERVKPSVRSIELAVRAKVCAFGLKIGDSVAVNGCCLTVARISGRTETKVVQFDLLRETWERTNLQFVRRGSPVNLERSLPVNGRVGGHFVTGHIDVVGTIVRWEKSSADQVLEIRPPREFMRYLVFKGSVAVDGISLTVAQVGRNSFRTWIIPHTLDATVLRTRTVGDKVNLEADVLGKYVERLLAFRANAR